MNLNVEPKVTKDREQFIIENPPYSVALDGYVKGGPFIDHKGPHVNFNHHEGVRRLETRSTTGQVFMLIKQRLFDLLSKNGSPYCEIFVNDPDQDTCLSSWLLLNSERITGQRSEPLLNRLLVMEDYIDTTAGAFPIDINSNLARMMGWIFEPYCEAKIEGRIGNMGPSEMRNVIEAVHQRINRHLLGDCSKIILNTDFKNIGGGKDWSMIIENGFYARSKLFSEGMRAFVSVREKGNGIYDYSIGKMSEVVNFPIQELYKVLNEAEGISELAIDKWGGGDIIGGSPRFAGSKLSPKELETIINDYLGKRQYIY